MRGGFRYSRKRVVKGMGLKNKYRTLRRRHNKKLRKSRRTAKRRYRASRARASRARASRKYMKGGSLSALNPAALNVSGENTIISGGQPSVGPNFNTSAGYGYDFNPPLGGVKANTQCTDY